ncbi:caspase family protein [Trichlorobacter lovleyi]|uniref:caspase family protein n=1 Tax=Trichlorobacter lovleyi TaxID=313985 RepID=UPI002240A045|nr:caspase family protein [Trichlorobacter lovleyi]QOX78621.1 caspase family protein [Trichlorobacter lovleyi]
MNRLLILLICLCFALPWMPVHAGQPPLTPTIRIQTDLHSAKIMDVSASGDGALLATASADKTVKLWETASGRLLRTIRPPIAAGSEGMLHAVALSPDGRLVAAAGWTGVSWDGSYSVYLFDTSNGEMRQRLTGFPKPLKRLAFSPDGKNLAVGLHSSGGVYLVRVSDGKRLMFDASLNGTCFGLLFDQKGGLLAGSDQGQLRRYTPDGGRVYAVQTEERTKLLSMALSPDNSYLALVYGDGHQVELRTAADGRFESVLQRPGGRFFSVAWSRDGKQILAAGNLKSEDGRKLLVSWSSEQRRPQELVLLPSKSGITQLLPLQDGALAVVSRLTGFGLLTPEGSTTVLPATGVGRGKKPGLRNLAMLERQPAYFHLLATADFQKNHDLFRISADAASVLFSYERNGQAPARFDLKKRRLVTVHPSMENLLPHRFTAEGLDVQHWQGGAQPLLNRVPLAGFIPLERSQSLAIRHDEKGFVLGTSHFIRAYSAKGALLWKSRTPFTAWDVALSADDSTLVAALDDGSIRWFRMLDGKERFALFPHPDRKRWIIWTLDGFFDHGGGSENLIGFQMNRGAEQAAVMVGAERMFDLLYRPDLLDRAIAGEDLNPYLQRLQIRADGRMALAVPDSHLVPAAALKKQTDQGTRTGGQQDAQERQVRPAQEQAAAEQKGLLAAETVRAGMHQGDAGRLPHQPAEPVDEAEQETELPPTVEAEPQQAEPKTALASLVTAATMPPKVRFLTSSGVTGLRDMRLQAELCDAGGGLGDVTLYLNKMPIVFEQSNRGLVALAKDRKGDCISFERVVTLAAGENQIELMAFNRANSIESERSRIVVRYNAPEPAKPRLHLLTIAVNSYQERTLGLKYSVNDADNVAKLVAEKAQKLFAGVAVYRLSDQQVTRQGLEQVFAEISAKVERGDVFVLFLAGHGLTDELDGMYYFLPADFRLNNGASLARQGISMHDFKQYISSIKATRSLFLIDTCSSGAFSEGMAGQTSAEHAALNKLARSVGRATLAASSRDQVALEGHQGHGVFSFILLQGLQGAAANRSGRITITNLALFVEETLPELTMKKWGYEQIPQKALIGLDFPIGIK